MVAIPNCDDPRQQIIGKICSVPSGRHNTVRDAWLKNEDRLPSYSDEFIDGRFKVACRDSGSASRGPLARNISS